MSTTTPHHVDPSPPPLRVLILEDDPRDAKLTASAIEGGGLNVQIQVTDSLEAFRESLEKAEYDVIVSDFNLRNWTAIDGLETLKQSAKDIPLIVVTGSLGDEAAVECIKKGAADFVLKDRPARLPTAIQRALEERRLRGERKTLEGQLQQAAKMEAVGRLAGGVAHDFNNLLTIINGYSELLLETLGSDDKASAYVLEIKNAGERAASLTRQLLAFSRRQVLAPQVLNLNVVIANVGKMLTRLIGEDVKLRTVLDPSLGRVRADPGQIEQVIMNLAVNARDAMPSGGILTLETGNVDLDKLYARNHVTVRPGPHVMLAVSDTGMGMTDETKARIFEPFYTTKDLGKGTGLGLATVYGIVKQSGGTIWVYSELGQGTVFKIYLPAVTEDVDMGHAATETGSVSGTETILVVEDEEAVRSLIRLALVSGGYKVLETDDAEKALAMCTNHKEPIHLLLTDVVMPKMAGPAVAEKVTALRPEVKVLFMSGYTDDAIVHHGVLSAGTPFIQKPFSPMTLRKKIREVLDRK